MFKAILQLSSVFKFETLDLLSHLSSTQVFLTLHITIALNRRARALILSDQTLTVNSSFREAHTLYEPSQVYFIGLL